MSYADYYAERWGQHGLQPGQPLLLAARVSRQQLARGLDMRRGRKRSFALHQEAEGGCWQMERLISSRTPFQQRMLRPAASLITKRTRGFAHGTC